MSYSNKQVEEKLKNAVSNVTPDVLESILSNCEDRTGVVIQMNTPTKKTNKLFKFAAASIALVIMAAGVLGYMKYRQINNVDSVIAFDVNPSIELKVNTSEKVIDINPLNDDAVNILGDMDFKGATLDVAVHALIGSMLEHGYISEIQNSILVTVKNNDSKKGAILEQRLSKEIEKLLKSNSVDAAIISQTSVADDNIEKLAKENNISVGKAKLINTIVSKDKTQNFKQLSQLSINELNLFAKSKKIALDDAISTGTASDKAYIGSEKAKDIALKHANVKNVKNVKNLQAEFDCDDGKIIYEVEFNDGNMEYDYDIDAITGKIIISNKKDNQKEDAINNDQDDKSDNEEDKPVTNIGESKAKNLAFAHAKTSVATVYDLDVEFERHNNKGYYDIDFKSANHKYNYKIDAVTGAIIKTDKKPFDSDEKKTNIADEDEDNDKNKDQEQDNDENKDQDENENEDLDEEEDED